MRKTGNDINLHFCILDMLVDCSELSAGDIAEKLSVEYFSAFENSVDPDLSTIRKKLKEYEKLSILKSYVNVVAKVLEQAIDGTLTDKNLYEIVSKNAISESVMNIPTALKSGEWELITPEYKTPIKHKPTMPLTTLEKRRLKALL